MKGSVIVNFAYLSQGKLYLKEGSQAVHEIRSEFGQSAQDRRRQVKRRQAMRQGGIQSMMQPTSMGQKSNEVTEAVDPTHITSLCRVDETELLYSLEISELGGLFRYNPTTQQEQRLFHDTEFRIGHLDYSSTHQMIACTKTYPTGTSNLATLNPRHHRPKDLTEGDSIDLAPRWVKHREKAIVYQSAGVSRNSSGLVINRSPFAVLMLDFQTQDVQVLAEDPKSDLLGPQCSHDGWLYYIRRPYNSFASSFNWKRFFKDIVLLPINLLYAIFQFFNMFSELMTGKPLINAVTRQKSEQPPLRTLGGIFLPENLPKKHSGEADTPPLVPASWELVRQGDHGQPEVLAKHVLSYDIAEDGSVLYSNGSAIYRIKAGVDGLEISSVHERILAGKMIESVVAVSTSSTSKT